MLCHWATKSLPYDYDAIAEDGSQIRKLLNMGGGSAVHCTLPSAGASMCRVSFSTVNIGIDEIWYFLEGEGELWRKNAEASETVAVKRGVCVTVPAGTVFQFRNTGVQPLIFLCITMPPWRPGTNVKVDECRWPASQGA